MCWLIFAGIRGYRGDPAAVFEARGLTANVSRNPTCAEVNAQDVLAITDGHCACSLYVYSQRFSGEDTQLMRARFRRKGWADGRIERAVKARCSAEEKRAGRRPARSQLPAMVEELVESGAEVALLAHYFEGSFDDPFPVRTRRSLMLAEFAGNGGILLEDELTVITR